MTQQNHANNFLFQCYLYNHLQNYSNNPRLNWVSYYFKNTRNKIYYYY